MHAVTVVIPNWNGRAHLTECLDSLAGQTFRDFEVVVVDNGSTDGSLELLAERNPPVRVIERGFNSGFSGAVNAGIEASESVYVALLNNDTRAEPGWLEALVTALEKTPGAAFAASRMLRWEPPHLVDSAGDRYSLLHGAGSNMGAGEPAARYDRPAWVFGACAGAALYRRSLFDDIGLFDEDFFLIFEDIDFDLRAQVAGHRCLYVPGAVVYHKRGASTDADSPDILAGAWRNLVWVAGKNLPPGLLAMWAAAFSVRLAGVFALAVGGRLMRRLGIRTRDLGQAHPPAPGWRAGRLASYHLPALREALREALRRLPEKRRQTAPVRRLGSLALAPVLLRPRRPVEPGA